MKEQKEKFSKITLDNYLKNAEVPVIQDFFISENFQPKITLNRSYIVEGVAISICVQGRGRLKINFHEHEITSNTVLMLLPGQMIEPLEISEDLVMQSLLFSSDFLLDFNPTFDIEMATKIGDNPCLQVSETEGSNLLDFYSFMAKYYKNDYIYREKIVKTLLFAFMMEIAGIYVTVKKKETIISNRKEEIFNKFFQLLFKYHKQERSIGYYADQMFLTPKYLSKVIKEVSGVPMLEWINRMVILTSKSLLRSSNRTVLQISEQLNFPNPSFFGRFFKKNTGMTPVQYRER